VSQGPSDLLTSDQAELFPSLSTRSLMFLKLSDLALPQMLAVEVLGALQEEEEEGLSPLGWRLARLWDLEIGWLEDTTAGGLQLGQGEGEGPEGPPGDDPGDDPRESIQLRPGDWRPYTDWVLPISASRTSLFPLIRANPLLTLLGASDSEKEKDLDILGRGGSVKMLPRPFFSLVLFLVVCCLGGEYTEALYLLGRVL